MIIPHRLVYLLAAALPALLIAIPALYILHRYLVVRDRLGTWTLTVRDDHDREVGHGELTLVATAWTVHWSRSSPYVDFIPELDDHAGRLTLIPLADDGHPIPDYAGSHPLQSPDLLGSGLGIAAADVSLDSDDLLRFAVDLQGLPKEDLIGTTNSIEWITWGDRSMLPLTIHAARP